MPPKPKLLLTATLTGFSLALSGTKSKSAPTFGDSRFKVAGTIPYTGLVINLLLKLSKSSYLMNRQNSKHGLNCTGSAKQMSHGTLGAAHGDL